MPGGLPPALGQHLVPALPAAMTVIAMGLSYGMSVADPTILSGNISAVRWPGGLGGMVPMWAKILK